jgi:hypothetical protein
MDEHALITVSVVAQSEEGWSFPIRNGTPNVTLLERGTTEDEMRPNGSRGCGCQVSPTFVVDVRIQNLVAAGEASLLSVNAVTFAKGVCNRWHRHTIDQILVVPEGAGVVPSQRTSCALNRAMSC